MNILVIGDTHIPFEHRDYLDFCLDVKRRFKCKTVVHIGDLVDNHAISYHEHDPDGWSPDQEMAEADKHLTDWYKAFPSVKLCKGNHDILVDRKGKTVGLPKRCFKEFKKIWNLPRRWVDEFEFKIDGVLFKHGTGYSGKLAHRQAAIDACCSTVMGHLPGFAGVAFVANSDQVMFGMNVGCGIDRKKYAFAYGKDFRQKPILGCGVVFNNRNAQFIPMEM